jgi:ribosomal protein L40E
MLKYKICSSCQSKNEPTLLECLYCEADLTRVNITDEETEIMLEKNVVSAPAASQKTTMERICDCGEKNPANARKCKACNEDISDIIPTSDSLPETESEKMSTYVLSSLDGQYVYKMATAEAVVGRENIMSNYLASKSYVSRTHAKLTVEEGSFYIENLSGTNFTYVNNMKIVKKTKLENGDELGLGGTNINGKYQSDAAYFLVRIDQCM